MTSLKKFKLEFKNVLKEIDWGFFFILLISVLTPVVYKLFRSVLVYSISSDTYETAVAWGYLYLIFETINIFVVLPAYAFIKKNINNENDIKQKTLLSLLFAFVAFIFTVLLIGIFAFPITNKFQTLNSNAFSNSQVYFYLFLFGISISIHLLINIFIAYIVLNKRKITAIIIPILNMTIIMTVDFLFLSSFTNINAQLMTVAYSSLTSSLIILFLIIGYFLISEGKSWIIAIKTLNFSKWKKDYKVYWSAGLWLAFEALIWNVFWILGVTTWISSDVEAAAFWTMDMLFWGMLLVPSTAIALFTAESISNSKSIQERQRAVKLGLYLSSLIYVIWIILIPIITFVIYPLIFNGGENAAEELLLAQKLSWIALIFFVVQVPCRTLYSYFGTTNQGFKAFFGTLIGVMLIWLPSSIIYFINPELIKNFELVVVIYGLGLVVIFVFYLLFWTIEQKKWYQPKPNGIWAKLTNYKDNFEFNFKKETTEIINN